MEGCANSRSGHAYTPRIGSLACSSLWSIQQNAEHGLCYTLMTCEPNQPVTPLHPTAMPVILEPGQYEEWLDTVYLGLCAMAQPYPAERMAVE